MSRAAFLFIIFSFFTASAPPVSAGDTSFCDRFPETVVQATTKNSWVGYFAPVGGDYWLSLVEHPEIVNYYGQKTGHIIYYKDGSPELALLPDYKYYPVFINHNNFMKESWATCEDIYRAMDTTPPNVTITYPSHGLTLNTSTITVTGTASDDTAVSKVEVSLNGEPFSLASGTESWSIAVTLQPGSNTIVARATDTSNNNATATITVTYTAPDTTKPSITITSPTDGQTITSSPITVSGTASDDRGLSKVEISLNGQAYEPASGTTTWSKSVSLTPGTNTIVANSPL